MTPDQALHDAAHDAAIVQLYPSPDTISQEMAEIQTQRRFLLAKACVNRKRTLR